MDTAWPYAPPAAGPQLNGLYDGLLSFGIPAANPQTNPTVPEDPPVTVEQLIEADMNRKRKLEVAEKESLEIFLAQLGSEEAGTDLISDSGLGMRRKHSDDKDAKLDTARNKATRERARRERLNDR